MIVKLKQADGYPVIINTDHMAFVGQAVMKAGNGSGPAQPMVGKSVLVMASGAQFVLDGTIDEVYGLIRRHERASDSIVEIGK